MSRMDVTLGSVICRDDILSDRACAVIREALQFAWWWPSELIQLQPDGRLSSTTSSRRTSETTSEAWMSGDVRLILRGLETRLAQTMAVGHDHLEEWQASRYRRGCHFAEHHDAGFFAGSKGGERTHTIVVYLDDHDKGGAIVFPQLKVRFKPQAGRILMWRNLLDDGTVDQRMRHVARPALRTKTILTTWARQRPVRTTSQE